MPERRKMQGFTLLELLIVLVVGAILVTVAAPSFQDTIKRNRVQSHIHDLAAVLNAARSEAVTRIETVSVCGSSNQTSCNNSSNWSAGWIVFIDDGAGGAPADAGDGIRNGDEEILKVYRHKGTNRLIVTDSAGEAVKAVSFGSRGFMNQDVAATLRVCEEGGDVYYARALLLERTGRVVRSFDLYDSEGEKEADGIYEDANGDNLTCS